MRNNEEIKAYLEACELMGIKTHRASSEEKRNGIVILDENGKKHIVDRNMKKIINHTKLGVRRGTAIGGVMNGFHKISARKRRGPVVQIQTKKTEKQR
ncbi:MAG: hypothetical protein IJ278_06165 [Clostridia bacterium]|nr:hypothetical protein [Clostridia bacterium]